MRRDDEMTKKRQVGSAVFFVVAVLLTAAYAHAQWTGSLVNGTIVDANYAPNPYGKYRFYSNRSGDSTYYNFSVNGQRIPMADPTVVKIGGWYYASGTTEAAAQQTNFAIYKSQDLVNWQPHMLAFKEDSQYVYDRILNGPFGATAYGCPIVYGSTTKTINGRTFRDGWAPQLYVAPDLPGVVWLSYTTREGDPQVLECNSGQTALPPQTVLVASISKAGFVAGGRGNYFAKNGWEPMTYFYEVNNTPGQGALDGGLAQGHTIPVSGQLPPSFSPCDTPACGEPYFAGRQFGNPDATTWGHACMGSNTWMALDSFVYFDPLEGGRRWMLYTWTEGFDTNWNGNHVAAYPMLDDRQMDALGTHLPIAYRFHWWYWPAQNFSCGPCTPETLAWPNPNPRDCWLLNGVSGANAAEMTGVCEDNYAVAEGPAAFYRNGSTYVMYSRNAWDSPAYGIFYRQGQLKLSGLALPAWNDYTTPEYPLVWATQTGGQNDRAIAYGPSFGHGEVFAGPTPPGEPQRYYLVFHAKQQASVANPPECGRSVIYPDGYSGRTVYFKELTFDANGFLLTLQNDDSHAQADTEGFLVPK